MTDNNAVTTAIDDSGNEYENLGALTVEQEEALEERTNGANATSEYEAAGATNAERDEQTRQAEAEAAERERQYQLERDAVASREAGFASQLARLISTNTSAIKFKGVPIVGAWANEAHIVVMADSETQISLFVDERHLYSYTVADAILSQARVNGHDPSRWSWSGTLGQVSGCQLCDALVRIGEDGIPRVDAYNKRCPKAVVVAGKRGK